MRIVLLLFLLLAVSVLPDPSRELLEVQFIAAFTERADWGWGFSEPSNEKLCSQRERSQEHGEVSL